MNILFLCTSNQHRSRTAEDCYKKSMPEYAFKSAGLSAKYCAKYGTTLCTIELLVWADKIFVMEKLHLDRIREYSGKQYLKKIQVLDIEDKYKYMQKELIQMLAEKLNERI